MQARNVDDSETRRLGDVARTVVAGFDGPADGGVEGPGARDVYGRYVLLERIGSGGMGLVHAAYDPQFDRKVALKLLWPGAGTRHAASLAREARTMAQLSHPNVVQVFDVGVQDGRIWMAMELVDGPSLDRWLAERSRSWPDVLDVFLAAGEGLAAAHGAGIVHRDFKPANVLITRGDGPGGVARVRVGDFGVARVAPDDSSAGGVRIPEHADDTLATSGAVGTPAFMAPEQYEGGRADERADQFSFCLALYAALYGRRPYRSHTPGALMHEKLAHDVAPPPRATRVPGRIHPILVRGLAPDPAARLGSMRELLDALRAATQRARRGRRAALAVVGAIGVAGLAWQLGGASSDARCSGGAAELEAVWNDERAGTLAAAFANTGLSYADETWTRAHRRIDAYAQGWLEAQETACRAAGPDDAIDRTMECFRGRLVRLEALLALLGDAEVTTVERAVQAVTGLPPVVDCMDASTGSARDPPPPEQASEVAELRARVAEAAALHDAGRHDEGRTAATAAFERCVALAYAPLVAEAALVLGRLDAELGEVDSAQEHLARAAWTAEAEAHDRIAAEAAIELTRLAGGEAIERGLDWARHADAALLRIGDPWELRVELLAATASLHEERADYASARALLLEARSRVPPEEDGPTRGSLELALGTVEYRQGHYDAAIEHDRDALGVLERGLGPEHPRVALALNALGVAFQQRGDFAAARRHHEQALELRSRALGDFHPDLAGSLSNLGAIAYAEGAYEESERHYSRSLAIKERLFGTYSVELVTALQGLGAVQVSRGELEAATTSFARALAIAEEAYGPIHPDVGAILGNLGVAWGRRKRPDRAREYLERALAIERESVGDDHPTVAITRINLGNNLHRLGESAAALIHHRAALASLAKALPKGHRNLAQARLAIARDLLVLGDAAEGRAILEEAVAELAEDGTALGASIDFALARALVQSGGSRKRAIELAEASLAVLEASGQDAAEEAAQARAWLDARR